MCPRLMSALQVVAWTDRVGWDVAQTNTHLYIPAHIHTAMCAHTPLCHKHLYIHTDTCGPFLPFWYCISFLFDVEFVFACRASVATKDSDV